MKDRFGTGVLDLDDHKLAWFELGVAFVCGVIWIRWPQVGWWPLLLASVPWVARLAGGQYPLKRTPLDIPIAIFIATAVVGVWASYDREAAWAKFWWIIAAVLLYFAVARQPKSDVWLVIGLITFLSLLLAGYFLLTYNWADHPANIGFVNRIARVWMSYRPGLPLTPPDSDITAGILATLAPLSLALGLHGWRSGKWKSWRLLLLAGMACLVVLWALFLAGDRASWLAFIPAVLLWLWWELSLPLGLVISRRPQTVFIEGVALVVALALILLVFNPGGVKRLADRLPGPDEAEGRASLWFNTVKLVEDYPITGAGLQAFPGQYSQYVMVIPYYYLDNSHNMFLEVGLEQGLLGLLALVLIIGGTYKSLWGVNGSPDRETPLEKAQNFTLFGALVASLTVLVLHGLLENGLYGDWDIWFLFLLPGLVIATTQPEASRRDLVLGDRLRKGILAVGLGGLLLVLISFWRPLLAAGYANMGAIGMARAELKQFPVGKWEDHVDMTALAPAESLFQRALNINPQNRTALHRLGLIALRRGDFPSAVNYLEQAFILDQSERGVEKELGYSYAWMGKIDQAANILAGIPEARAEMDAYSSWWSEHGHPELAYNAKRVGQALPQNQ